MFDFVMPNVTHIDIAYSSRAPEQNRIYWDQGGVGLERLKKEHHRVCKNNIYCNRLGLCNLVVKGNSPLKARAGQSLRVEDLLNLD